MNNGIYATTAPGKDTYLYNKFIKEVRRLEKHIVRQDKKIAALTEENKKLKEKCKKQEGEIKRLKSIIKNDSNNSSLPPSTDQKPSKAPNEYNSRVKTGKKVGGQVGHTGTTLSKSYIEEQIALGKLSRRVIYTGDHTIANRYIKKRYISRYVVDLEINPVVYEYRFPINQPLPQEFQSEVVYGNNLKTLAINLAVEQSVATKRISNILHYLSDDTISLSTGTITNFIYDFADKCDNGTIDNITNELKNTRVIYTDATNVTVNGLQEYIRNQSTKGAVFYSPMQSKSIEALSKLDVLKNHHGVLVHDDEAALFHFDIDHAECNAHIMRYLNKVTAEAKNSWSKRMKKLLKSINKHRRKLIEAGGTFTEEELNRYDKLYDKILKKGYKQNEKVTWRYAKDKEQALLGRMTKNKNAHLFFMYDFDVEFTNNISERDLRKCKTKQKVSGGFRSQRGKESYCTIMSVIETCKRKQINVFEGISRILNGEVLFGAE